MGKDSSTTCYKNAICASVGLLIVFTTSIFVAKDYFGLRIATLIDQAALLKDYRYADWGQFPGNIDAEYTYSFAVYDQQAGGMQAKSDPALFRHSFAYRDASFGQGNQGFIKFWHDWDLAPAGALPTAPVSTINLAAEKVYNYEHLAPPARRFATLYNTLWGTVEQQLLPFFAAQLHAFYFQNRKAVEGAVFSEAGLPAETAEAIYSHETYGWGKSETFQPWVMLAHQKNRKEAREYELIQEAVGISAAELERLVGEHSMLNTLSTALNGTIKLILENPRSYVYRKCVPFCSNTQLVAFELLTGALTANPVFVNVNLKASLRDLNASLPADVELNKFAPAFPLDENSIDFLTAGYLGNFSALHKVFTNLSNVERAQEVFGLPDADSASTILDYMEYLQDNIFNPTNPATQEVDTEAYEYMINNHLYVNGAVNALKDVLNIEVHTRAMAQLIQDGQIKCEDFFTGDYKGFVGLCAKEGTDVTKMSTLRTYVRAYFFQNRANFFKLTGMNLAQAGQFLRLDAQSLFAAKIKQIRIVLSAKLGCSTGFCSEEELLAMEWSGEQDVLSRLPEDLFPVPPASINEWDVDNRLAGVQPQFHKLAGEKLATEQGKLLLGSGPESILVLFNLLSLKAQCDAGDATAKKLVNYVQKVSLDVFFGGATTTRPLSEVLLGFESAGMREKREAGELVGGAAWLPAKVQLMKTSHRPKASSKIDTGIYGRNHLRSILEVEQSNVLGSTLTLFKSEYEEVTEFLSSERSVFGSSLLGFHSDLSASESLKVLLDFAYQSVSLIPAASEVKFNGVDAIDYTFASPKTFIGLNEQNERSISIDPASSFTVDPITGNTLQFSVKFTVSSPAPFLKYYPSGSTGERPLFDCEVSYSRKDVSAITEIADEKAALRTVYILMIVLASLSMISIAVFAVILRVKRSSSAKELKDTLISSEGSSLVGSVGGSIRP